MRRSKSLLFRPCLSSRISSSSTSLLSRVPTRLESVRNFTVIHPVPEDEQLSCAIVTPKSLAKSLTGGIVARLLATPGLQIVGARMLKPSAALTEEFRKEVERAAFEDGVLDPYEKTLIESFSYIFGEEELKESGIDNHIMFLLFAGSKNTRNLLETVVGTNVPQSNDFGKTIRGTYGDYFVDRNGSIGRFQPGVLFPQSDLSNRKMLELFAKYLDQDHILKKINLEGSNGKKETGLVMIKPDNLERPSSLPGHIIDMFGTTGLQLVGARVFSMSLQDGIEFYGFLEKVFVKKLQPNLAETIKNRLSPAFDFSMTSEDFTKMSEVVVSKYAHSEVSKIIQYMTGIHPDSVKDDAERHQPGPAKCFALLYNGENAIDIIRSKLGTTDPRKAKAGTIRSDYGHDLMRNGAHASDATDSALRERKIVGLMGDEPSAEKDLIKNWLKSSSL